MTKLVKIDTFWVNTDNIAYVDTNTNTIEFIGDEAKGIQFAHDVDVMEILMEAYDPSGLRR